MSEVNLFEEVKRRAELLNLVEEFSEATITGRGNQRQLSECPFCTGHGCFSISISKQLFKCFQCAEAPTGGDVFTFMEKLRGYDSFSALKEIAEYIAYPLPEKKNRIKPDIREVIALKLKNDWMLPQAKYFWSYLTEIRKLNPDVLKTQDVGFYFDRQDMIAYLKNKGFCFAEIESSGILTRYFGAFYRIVFSWRSVTGKVEGFVGAATRDQLADLSKEEKNAFPKYKKNANFHTTSPFNLYFAKRWVPSDQALVFVEGIVDCLQLQSIGVMNVVALGGSAFHTDFIDSLHKTRYERLIFLFDADLGGSNATSRAIQLIWAGAGLYALYVSEIVMTDPEDPSRMINDPDELVRKLGGDVLRALIRDPVKAGPWLVGSLWATTDMKSPLQRDQVLEQIGGFWHFIKDPVEKKEILKLLSKACDVPQESLASTLEIHASAPKTHGVDPTPQKRDDADVVKNDQLKELKMQLSILKKEKIAAKKEYRTLLKAYGSFVVHTKWLSKSRLSWHLSRLSDGHTYLLKLIKKKSPGVHSQLERLEDIFYRAGLKNIDQIQKDLSVLIQIDHLAD